MAIVGYARTSTLHQGAGLEAQLETLKTQGCDKIFSEQVSSVAERAKLDRALEYVREGDVLVVTKLDRLARSVAHLCQIVAELERKGVALKILDIGVNTSCPAGRLFLNMLGSIAQFEREIMLERQRDGIAAAKAAGKFTGRQPTARAKAGEVKTLAAQGVAVAEIAKRLGISERSVYRIVPRGKQ
jgi:DNA invertase Pin-like site-specific DNA recombinase